MMQLLVIYVGVERKTLCQLDFSSRRLLGGRASRDNHPFLSPPLPHEFPFNCDTSSGLWRTAHPVISRYYLGMRGQVLPVQSMSARCTVPWAPSLSICLSVPPDPEKISLSSSISVDHSSRRCDANFFPFACSTLRAFTV